MLSVEEAELFLIIQSRTSQATHGLRPLLYHFVYSYRGETLQKSSHGPAQAARTGKSGYNLALKETKRFPSRC